MTTTAAIPPLSLPAQAAVKQPGQPIQVAGARLEEAIASLTINLRTLRDRLAPVLSPAVLKKGEACVAAGPAREPEAPLVEYVNAQAAAVGGLAEDVHWMIEACGL